MNNSYYYVVEVGRSLDYYPFGMLMPNRHGSTDSYRYGFGGKEEDNSVKGNGNHLDFGARAYDSRLGRWFSTDAFEYKYSGLTPYAYGANNPIFFVDIDGNDIVGLNVLLKSKAFGKLMKVALKSPTFSAIIKKFQGTSGDMLGSITQGSLGDIDLIFKEGGTEGNRGLTEAKIIRNSDGTIDWASSSITIYLDPDMIENGEKLLTIIHEVGIHVASLSKNIEGFRNQDDITKADSDKFMDNLSKLNVLDHEKIYRGPFPFQTGVKEYNEINKEIVKYLLGDPKVNIGELGTSTGYVPHGTDFSDKQNNLLFDVAEEGTGINNVVKPYLVEGVEITGSNVFWSSLGRNITLIQNLQLYINKHDIKEFNPKNPNNLIGGGYGSPKSKGGSSSGGGKSKNPRFL